jgi:hypothetical protein
MASAPAIARASATKDLAAFEIRRPANHGETGLARISGVDFWAGIARIGDSYFSALRNAAGGRVRAPKVWRKRRGFTEDAAKKIMPAD